MGVVEDIVNGMESILDSAIDKGLEMLLKVIVSGFTLITSAPGIALATHYNNQIGFVDPLLLPPINTTAAQIVDFGVIEAGDVVTRATYLQDSYVPYSAIVTTPSSIADEGNLKNNTVDVVTVSAVISDA